MTRRQWKERNKNKSKSIRKEIKNLKVLINNNPNLSSRQLIPNKKRFTNSLINNKALQIKCLKIKILKIKNLIKN